MSVALTQTILFAVKKLIYALIHWLTAIMSLTPKLDVQLTMVDPLLVSLTKLLQPAVVVNVLKSDQVEYVLHALTIMIVFLATTVAYQIIHVNLKAILALVMMLLHAQDFKDAAIINAKMLELDALIALIVVIAHLIKNVAQHQTLDSPTALMHQAVQLFLILLSAIPIKTATNLMLGAVKIL